jgi:DNA-directed RNA polymerase specialized sigma24 family protein
MIEQPLFHRPASAFAGRFHVGYLQCCNSWRAGCLIHLIFVTTTEETTIMGKDAERLRAMLDQLDRSDRYVVLMWYADELNDWEIAAVLERSVLEVRRVINAFREKAASALRPAGNGDGLAVTV